MSGAPTSPRDAVCCAKKTGTEWLNREPSQQSILQTQVPHNHGDGNRSNQMQRFNSHGYEDKDCMKGMYLLD